MASEHRPAGQTYDRKNMTEKPSYGGDQSQTALKYPKECVLRTQQQAASDGIAKVSITEPALSSDVIVKDFWPTAPITEPALSITRALELGLSAAARGLDDDWLRIGGYLMMIHSKARCDLFTPFRVACSPPGRELLSFRLTRGHFSDGEGFERIDNFRNRNEAHLESGLSWTGVTLFLLRNVLEPCSGTLCDRDVKDTSAVGGSRNMSMHNNIIPVVCNAARLLEVDKSSVCIGAAFGSRP